MVRPTTESGTAIAERIPRTSDEDLLLRYRETKDKAAFSELVHRYERELYGYLRRYLRDAHLAQDIFQATFIQVHQKADLFEEGRRFRPWLYSMATHLAIDVMRKRGRRAAVSLERRRPGEGDGGAPLDVLESETPGPLAELEDEEQRERVRNAVDRLPEHLRDVVMLVYFQGLKYSETADALDVPLGTVKSRIHAALAKLNTIWRSERRTDRPKPRSEVRRPVGTGSLGSESGSRPSASASGFGSRRGSGLSSPVHRTLSSLRGDHRDVVVPDGLARSTCRRVDGMSVSP